MTEPTLSPAARWWLNRASFALMPVCAVCIAVGAVMPCRLHLGLISISFRGIRNPMLGLLACYLIWRTTYDGYGRALKDWLDTIGGASGEFGWRQRQRCSRLVRLWTCWGWRQRAMVLLVVCQAVFMLRFWEGYPAILDFQRVAQANTYRMASYGPPGHEMALLEHFCRMVCEQTPEDARILFHGHTPAMRFAYEVYPREVFILPQEMTAMAETWHVQPSLDDLSADPHEPYWHQFLPKDSPDEAEFVRRRGINYIATFNENDPNPLPLGAGAMIEIVSGPVGAAACLASILGIGYALVTWLRAGEASDRRPARPGLGWAFLLGTAAVGLTLQIPLAIDGRITHRSFALVGIVGLAALAWAIARWRRTTAPPRGLPWGWFADLPMLGRLLAVVALPAAAVYCCRTNLTGYDARSIYALKARILYDSGTLRGEDFQDIQRVHFNPAYPLLTSLVEAQIYWTQGGYATTGLKLLFLLFPLSVVSIHAGQLRRFGARGLAALLALMFLFTPMFLECFEGAGLSGSADLPLAALVFAGVLEISRWIRRPDWRPAVSAALLLGAAATTKAEGIAWIAACAAGLAATWLLRPARPQGRQLATALAGGSVLALTIVVRQCILGQLPNSPYYPSYFAALDWHWLKQLGDRPLTVLRYGIEEIIRVRFWNLMWPCIIGSLVLLRRGRVPTAVLFWRFTAVAGMAASLAALAITPLHLEYELRTSFSRLMLHAFPLAVLIMAEQMAASGFSGQLAESLRVDESRNEPAEAEPAENAARAA